MVFFKTILFYKVITVYLMQQMCMYLTLQQSMKLLTVEYQKGHTSYEERAHFLVFKQWGGGGSMPMQCTPCSAASVRNSDFQVKFGRLGYLVVRKRPSLAKCNMS